MGFEGVQQNTEKVDDHEDAPRLRECLDQIDVAALQDVFLSFAEQYGIAPEKVNFIHPDDFIEGGTGYHSFGRYSPVENSISFDMDQLRYINKEKLQVSESMLLLRTVIHEETHAVSHVDCTYTEGRRKTNKPLTKVGFSQTVSDVDDATAEEVYYLGDSKQFELFNEGVTEMITEELLDKYNEQTHLYDESTLQEFRNDMKKNRMSELVVSLVKGCITRLARATETDRSEIWEAIKAAYMQGDSLVNGQLREYIVETLGDVYLEHLRNGTVMPVEKHERTVVEQLTRDMKAMLLRVKRKIPIQRTVRRRV